jgi:hypothetical protein
VEKEITASEWSDMGYVHYCFSVSLLSYSVLPSPPLLSFPLYSSHTYLPWNMYIGVDGGGAVDAFMIVIIKKIVTKKELYFYYLFTAMEQSLFLINIIRKNHYFIIF